MNESTPRGGLESWPDSSARPSEPVHPPPPVAPVRLIPLAECRDLPLAEVGAKAKHLAAALAAGHRVPPGVVLPCDSLTEGVTQAVIDAAWEGAQSLGGGSLAVRSSGVAEDGVEHSFAGQFLTVLSVRGREELAESLRACHASASSSQVRSYGRNGAQPMALLVQRQVEAACAGVAFSANPVTGARDEVVINAVQGLGDRLVNGEVTPEELTVRGEEVERVGIASVLDDPRAREVARAVRRLEEAFGAPQDVEWAFDGQGLAILQSRPVTALPPEPIPVPFDPPPGAWTRNDHHTTISPMAFGLFFDVYDGAMARALAKFAFPILDVRSVRIGGHLYTRMSFEGEDDQGTPPGWLLWILSRLVPSMRRMNRRAAEVFGTRLHHREMTEWEEVRKHRFDARLHSFDVDGLKDLDDEELLDRWDQAVAFVHEGARAHAETIGNWIAMGEFALFGRRHLGWDLATSLQAMQGWSRATTGLRDSLLDIVRAHLSREDASGAVSALDAAGPLDLDWSWMEAHPAFRHAFDGWFRTNRLRIQDYDLHNPTLGESPEMVTNLLRDTLETHAGDRPDPRGAVEYRRERLHEEARTRLAGTPLLEEFEELAHWCERAYGYRDENGFYTIARPLGLARLHLLEIGRRIEGLEDPAHAVYLEPPEIPEALRGQIDDLPSRIARRRGEEQWARFHRGPKRIGPPEAPLPDTAPFPAPLRKLFDLIGWMMEVEPPAEDADPSDPRLLTGRAASSGRHTGPARIVRGPDDFDRLQPGDVMVCRITSGEWSVAFGSVGALVTEEGGFLSHPAIIAREFGIPAVVGTDVALQRIEEGVRVTVDGDAGRVWVGEGEGDGARA